MRRSPVAPTRYGRSVGRFNYDGSVKVDFSPCSRPQFAGALKQQRCQLQGSSHDGATPVSLNGPQQFAQLHRFGDGGKVAAPVWGQGAFQVGGNVSAHPPGRHAIAPDLAAQHQSPVCSLDSTAFFNFSQSSEQLYGLDIGQPALAEPRKKITLKLAK